MNGFLKNQKLLSVLAIVVIGLIMQVQSAHAAAGSCGAWTVVTSPGPGQDYFYSVVAVSARNVWAVGGYQTGGMENTLIEHWNGTNWRVVSSPNAGSYISVLESVAAITPKDIWAVGFSIASSSSLLQTLIEHWDGTSWTIVSSPNPGGYDNLVGVTRVPGTNQLWAVGNYYNSVNDTVQHTLVEFWNGISWSTVSSPNTGPYGNLLQGVSARSATDVWSVGAYYTTNSGFPQSLIEHWNGTSWSIVASPNPGGLNALSGVTRIPRSKQVWAVGNYLNASGSFQTLTEQWNGTSWNVVNSPNPGATENTFVGVTALSADAIWAVGYYTDGNGSLQTLIEQWNGTSWNVVPSPSPGTSNELWSVARVPNTGQLWTVGNYANSNGAQGLTEFYC